MTQANQRVAACAMVCAVLLAIAPAAFGQNPSVELRLGARSLEVGETIDVQLVCSNADNPRPAGLDVPEGLELKLLNPNPSTMSQSSWINGRVSQSTTHTYSLRLRAIKPGKYTVGPLFVDTDGATLSTRPVVVVVRKSFSAPAVRGDAYVFANIAVRPTSLYVTESCRATLTIGIRKVELDGRVYDLDLRKLIGRGSDLSVFSGERARASRMNLKDSNGVPHDYDVYLVTKNIRAEKVGPLTIGPVFLSVKYPTRLRRGFWGDLEVSRSRKETARAERIVVEAKGPPEAGRPESFTGAIGTFNLQVTAKPLQVEQGQPVTLTITVAGSPLEGVAGPDLTTNAELASRFDYSGDELIGDLEAGAKVFRRAVFPRQEGKQTLPPIVWSFFSPRSQRYITLKSDPIALTVNPPSDATSPITLAETGDHDPTVSPLTLLAGGISPNYIDAEEVLADQAALLAWPGVAAVGVMPPVAWLIAMLMMRHRARVRGDAGFARRRRARGTANARIRRALGNGQSGGQLEDLAKALMGYLSDRFNLAPGKLTPDEVQSVLERHQVEESVTEDVVAFLTSCDRARYAPGSGNHASVAGAAGRVRAWVTTIEKAKP